MPYGWPLWVEDATPVPAPADSKADKRTRSKRGHAQAQYVIGIVMLAVGVVLLISGLLASSDGAAIVGLLLAVIGGLDVMLGSHRREKFR